MGKFINIFAFLFGLSFFIQMDRAAKKGVDFRKRFLWRMVILFVIGMIGNCFYRGEILSVYAVFGVLMVFLFRVKNWILVSIVLLLLIGTPRIISTSYDRLTKVEQTTEEQPRVRPQPPTAEKPSFINSVKSNMTSGMQSKINYQFGMFARGYITLALFIMGLVVGRSRFFEQVHIQKRRNILLLGGCIIAIVILDFITGLFPEQSGIRSFMGSGSNIPPSLLATMALNDIRSVLFSGALALGFIALYQTKGIGRCLDVISPYGRMGLTNYMMQNIIGCFLFSLWAFGSIFGNWHTTELFLLGLVIYSAQVIISKYWMKYYLYGPFEWFWRSATYLKLQPFRRK